MRPYSVGPDQPSKKKKKKKLSSYNIQNKKSESKRGSDWTREVTILGVYDCGRVADKSPVVTVTGQSTEEATGVRSTRYEQTVYIGPQEHLVIDLSLH